MQTTSPDHQLEQLLQILINRFGSARTLGEVYATTYALRTCRQGRSITLADVAASTGIAKQNLSRWLKVHIDTEQVVTHPYQDDGRMQMVDIVDLDYAARHLPAIAEALGSALDPAWTKRVEEATRCGRTSGQLRNNT